MKKIIIDLLGSDLGIDEMLEGFLLAYKEIKDFHYVLVGQEEIIKSFLDKNEIVENVSIIDAKEEVDYKTQYVEMFKDKNDTALVKSLEYLKQDEEAKTLVTASQTGCVLVGSIFHLGLTGNLKFPVLACRLFHKDGKTLILVDCGANVDAKKEDLLNFAILGSEYYANRYQVEKPRVGILSNGSERGKGNALVKEAYPLLEAEEKINFVGNVEFSSFFDNLADVIVGDGFIANSILKVSEEVALICAKMAEIRGYTDLSKDIKDLFNYTDLGSAFLLGTKKQVYKVHGACNRSSLLYAIKQSLNLID